MDFNQFLKSFVGEPTIDSKQNDQLKENFKKVDNAFEFLNKKLEKGNAELNALAEARAKTYANSIKATGKYQKKLQNDTKKYDAEIAALQLKKDKTKEALKKVNILAEKKMEATATKFGMSVEQLKKSQDKFAHGNEKYIMDVDKQIIAAFKSNKNFSSITESMGMFADFIAGDFTKAISFAIDQMFELNDRLIDNMRKSGGTLSANTLGFDNSGNNILNSRGSLKTMSASSGLSTEEFLKTTQAFNQGNIIGGIDLKDQTNELQQYGLEIGRLTKFYGINESEIESLTQTLTQQYGKSIEETTDILQHGASVARDAGLNVKIFFDNLSKLASLQNQLFIKGGAEGLEKTALALSKLGLKADILPQIESQYKTFGSLISLQQKMTGLALNNASSVQERVFSKLVVGDQSGAATLRLTSLAKDLTNQGWMKGGQIQTGGIELAKAAGYSDEEIGSMRRMGKEAEKLGVSFNSVATETGLTTAQLREKRQMDYNELKWMEKINKLGAQLNSLIIDPLSDVLGPALDIIISGLSGFFDIVSLIATPLKYIFQLLGKALGSFAEKLRELSEFIGDIKKWWDNWNPLNIGKESGEGEGKQNNWQKTGEFASSVLKISLGAYSLNKLAPAYTQAITQTVLKNQVIEGFLVNKLSSRFPKLAGNITENAANRSLLPEATGTAGKMAKLFTPMAGRALQIGAGLAFLSEIPQVWKTFADNKSTVKDKSGSVGELIGATGGAALGLALAGPVGGIIGAEIGRIGGRATGEWMADQGWFGTASKEDYIDANVKANKRSQITMGTVSIGGGGMNEQVSNIMNAKRMDNNLAAQGQAENAAFKTSHPTVNVRTDVHTHLVGGHSIRRGG